MCVFSDNDFDEDESATSKMIISKCFSNSIASLNACSEPMNWNLSGASLDDTYASAIVNALDGKKTLITLDLTDNCFTETGLAEIAKMMETNSKIQLAHLRGAFVSFVEQDRLHSKRARTSTCRLVDYSNIGFFTCCGGFTCGMLAGNKVDDENSAAVQAIRVKCEERKVSRACIQHDSTRTKACRRRSEGLLDLMISLNSSVARMMHATWRAARVYLHSLFHDAGAKEKSKATSPIGGVPAKSIEG